MNLRLRYNITLELDFVKENEELIVNKFKEINDDKFTLVFENVKSFTNLYGPSMIVSLIHLCDQNNIGKSKIIVDLEARYNYFDKNCIKTKKILEMLLFLNGLSRTDSETTISCLIEKNHARLINAKYNSLVKELDISHKFINNKDYEVKDFINHLEYYNNNIRKMKYIID